MTIAPQESCVSADSCGMRAAITDAGVVNKTLHDLCVRASGWWTRQALQP